MLGDMREDEVTQSPWVTHSVHMELVYGTCALDMDVADVEKGEEDATHLCGNVLDAGDEHARDFAVEEAVLGNLDDAHIGEHPDIQVVAGVEAPRSSPHQEEPYPEPGATRGGADTEAVRIRGEGWGNREESGDDKRQDGDDGEWEKLEDEQQPVLARLD